MAFYTLCEVHFVYISYKIHDTVIYFQSKNCRKPRSVLHCWTSVSKEAARSRPTRTLIHNHKLACDLNSVQEEEKHSQNYNRLVGSSRSPFHTNIHPIRQTAAGCRRKFIYLVNTRWAEIWGHTVLFTIKRQATGITGRWPGRIGGWRKDLLQEVLGNGLDVSSSTKFNLKWSKCWSWCSEQQENSPFLLPGRHTSEFCQSGWCLTDTTRCPLLSVLWFTR